MTISIHNAVLVLVSIHQRLCHIEATICVLDVY